MTLRALLFAALGILYLLHTDLWLWDDGRLWLGLPAGLTYHVLYCLATAGLMALLVRYAWPSDLAGGGVLMDLGVHALDALFEILDAPITGLTAAFSPRTAR